MDDRHYTDGVHIDTIEDRIREAVNEGSPDLTIDHRVLPRVLSDSSLRRPHLVPEVSPDVRRLLQVPPASFPKILRRCRGER